MFAPLVQVIPNEAAVPALVLVGFLMMQQVTEIDWDDLDIAIPAFLTIILMPFTYSITVGIGAGFVAFVLIKVVRGKVAEIHPMMWVDRGALRRLLLHRADHRPGHRLTPPAPTFRGHPGMSAWSDLRGRAALTNSCVGRVVERPHPPCAVERPHPPCAVERPHPPRAVEWPHGAPTRRRLGGGVVE